MESKLVIKNVSYNKYHEIFLFISKNGFTKYRKKDVLINPIKYLYYSVNTFNKKKTVDIEIDSTYDKLILFLYKFSDKYAYNKFTQKTYINKFLIKKYTSNPNINTILELYTWL